MTEERKKNLNEKLLNVEIAIGKALDDLKPMHYSHSNGGEESIGHRFLKNAKFFEEMMDYGLELMEALERE